RANWICLLSLEARGAEKLSYKLVLACKIIRILQEYAASQEARGIHDNHSLTADALAGRANRGLRKGATPHEVAYVLRILHGQGFVEARIRSTRSPARWELNDWLK
ncbi:unnamed protein product, partial [marine sediment metagenome]